MSQIFITGTVTEVTKVPRFLGSKYLVLSSFSKVTSPSLHSGDKVAARRGDEGYNKFHYLNDLIDTSKRTWKQEKGNHVVQSPKVDITNQGTAGENHDRFQYLNHLMDTSKRSRHFEKGNKDKSPKDDLKEDNKDQLPRDDDLNATNETRGRGFAKRTNTNKINVNESDEALERQNAELRVRMGQLEGDIARLQTNLERAVANLDVFAAKLGR